MATGTASKQEQVETPATTIITQVMEVDVATAREWLDTMAPNRNISRSNLENLIRAMEEGRWHTDGSPIKFDRGGRLIDGQHRLLALLHVGEPQTFLVVWGIDAMAMTTLDTGKSRNRADVLKIHDPELVDANNIAATTTMMLRWSKGVRNNNLRNEYVSNDEAVVFYDANKEDIAVANRHGRKMNHAVRAGSSQAFSLCYWLFTNIDAEDAEFFWDRVIDGQGLEVGNPIYALRELLRRESLASHTRDRMRSDVVIALTIKAWNAYRKGDEVKILHFKVGGAHPEKYPEPV